MAPLRESPERRRASPLLSCCHPPPSLAHLFPPTEWSEASPAATENRPDCELNIVTAPRQFFGFPYCATGPAGGDPNDRPYLRRPGATSIADPELNAGQAAMNCSGERPNSTLLFV